jgi:hypothetical protein
MSYKNLEDLKKAFLQPKAESENFSTPLWKRFYPFFKMQVGETAVVRFLPDGDTSNDFGFIRENLTHSLIVNR